MFQTQGRQHRHGMPWSSGRPIAGHAVGRPQVVLLSKKNWNKMAQKSWKSNWPEKKHFYYFWNKIEIKKAHEPSMDRASIWNSINWPMPSRGWFNMGWHFLHPYSDLQRERESKLMPYCHSLRIDTHLSLPPALQDIHGPYQDVAG